LMATPFGAVMLASTLETVPALDIQAAHASGAQAIVVLGGASYANAPEYEESTVGADTLVRVRYAAALHRELDLPVATIGGEPLGNGVPVGLSMAKVLGEEFQVPVTWVEANSRNTAENAMNSRDLLASAPRILLVTHAMHMPRAQRMFELAGFKVVPAPTAFASGPGQLILNPLGFLPSAGYLATSRDALHEWIGLAWYRLHYRHVADDA
jgi:uncharacterized SAM-binding protein YcdF (DUF218 family)